MRCHWEPATASSRMLKTSASGVLAAVRGSTYRSVSLASLLAAALMTAFLSILQGRSPVVPHVRTIEVLACRNSFSTAFSLF